MTIEEMKDLENDLKAISSKLAKAAQECKHKGTYHNALRACLAAMGAINEEGHDAAEEATLRREMEGLALETDVLIFQIMRIGFPM